MEAELQKKSINGVKKTILVVSGKGGVGKSTVATNLALTMSMEGYKTGLVDADIYGPSIPTMFGITDERPQVVDLGEGDKYLPIKKFGLDIISIGNFIDPSQAVIWRGPLASKALMDIITNTVWNDIDLLILDMPPGTSDIHITVAQEYVVDGAIIVTTPQKVANIDALKSGMMLKNEHIQTEILGIIENMAYFETDRLKDDKFYIFGKGGGEKLAEELNTEMLGQIPIIESICEYGDNGNPSKNFANPILKSTYMDLAKKIINKIELTNTTQENNENS